VIIGIVALRWDWKPAPHAGHHDDAAVATIHLPAASAWAYRESAIQGDDALLAMLDHDARTLLPPTPSAFSIPLPTSIP
jgi:hypothetical protein